MATYYLTEIIKGYLDHIKVVGGVFLDLRKPSYTVNYKILLHKFWKPVLFQIKFKIQIFCI